MRKHLYLISVLSCLLGLLWACTPSVDKADVLLVHAGECMETYPDSALYLLQQIPHPDRLHGRQQAPSIYYNILMMKKEIILLDSKLSVLNVQKKMTIVVGENIISTNQYIFVV